MQGNLIYKRVMVWLESVSTVWFNSCLKELDVPCVFLLLLVDTLVMEPMVEDLVGMIGEA